MKYRKLTNYKYQLTEEYSIKTEIYPKEKICEPENTFDYFISLKPNGCLYIDNGYSWDGPSGTTIDTKNFMRGSLVHDALYQLMRKGRISIEHREYADQLLKKICIEDGMSSFRAEYVYRAVRMFGESSASPTGKKEMQEEIIEIL